MKNSRTLKSVLFILGLIVAGIGSAILFVPVAFFATNGIEIAGHVNLLNEIRAPGGALLACGLLIMLGAFVAKLTFTSALISILLYLSYGLSRILSMTVDGMPTEGLVVVTVIEIALGLIGLFAFLKYREVEGRSGV